ncbi:hypothetical protein F4604DRAFT_1685359 [Suillus subluteus]|nr:hypothetical protein F4604DRAFT_1685359 [Suillus subluteus]
MPCQTDLFSRDLTNTSAFSCNSKSNQKPPPSQEDICKWITMHKATALCFIRDVFPMRESIAKAGTYSLSNCAHCWGSGGGIEVSQRWMMYTNRNSLTLAVLTELHSHPLPPPPPPATAIGYLVQVIGRVMESHGQNKFKPNPSACDSTNNQWKHALTMVELHKFKYVVPKPFKIPAKIVPDKSALWNSSKFCYTWFYTGLVISTETRYCDQASIKKEKARMPSKPVSPNPPQPLLNVSGLASLPVFNITKSKRIANSLMFWPADVSSSQPAVPEQDGYLSDPPPYKEDEAYVSMMPTLLARPVQDVIHAKGIRGKSCMVGTEEILGELKRSDVHWASVRIQAVKEAMETIVID